jgi:outer membrane protein assembly factor BamB
MRRWLDNVFWEARRFLASPKIVMLGLLVLLVMTGCAGRRRGRQVSWPGLTLVDDVIYVADLEQLQAFDAESGEVLWHYPQEPDPQIGFYATPVIDEASNLLLAAGFNSRVVYALRLGETPGQQPALLWTFEEAKGQYVGSGVVYENLFLIGNGDGRLYALTLESGELAWTFDVPTDRIWARPVLVDDIVYVASLDKNLYAVDPSDGSLIWQRTLNGAVAGTPVVVDNTLWVGDFGNTFHQIDRATGEVLWSYAGQDWFWSSPVAQGATVFVADIGGTVYALDTVAREMRWTAQIEDTVRGQPAFSADGDILFVPGYERGLVHALDVESGQTMAWGTVPETPGRLPSNLVTDENHLYVMPILIPERVRAFALDSGTLAWAYSISEE